MWSNSKTVKWLRKENKKLSEENNQLQETSDRYERVMRIMGPDTVETVVQQDIKEQKALKEQRRMEKIPKGSIHERLTWGTKKSAMEDQQRKKNKTKYRGMEI